MKPIGGLIVKPVGNACNLRCRYCYAKAHQPSTADFMPLDLAKRLVAEAVQQPGIDRVEFIWHGGEPLLRGRAFFEEVFQYLRSVTPPRVHVCHALQTNITLVTDEWLSFLRDWRIGISTSLDGPEWIHDRHRVFKSGVGTYSEVRSKIEKARKAGVRVNVISVVTEWSVPFADEIYSHAASMGLPHIAFLPCYVLDENYRPAMPTLRPGLFGQFLCRIFDRYMEHHEYPQVRECEQVFRLFTNTRLNLCNFNGSCHEFVCVSADGSVYSCDTTPLGANFRFGSIATDRLGSVLSSERRKAAIERTDAVPRQCRTCTFWSGCHGGCPNQRPDGRYYFCKDRRVFYRHVESYLANLVDDLTAEGRAKEVPQRSTSRSERPKRS